MIKTVLAIVTLCALLQVSLQKSDVLPQKIIDYFGSRTQRYHHFLWHNLRENWYRLDASTQHAITQLGWAPPRPALAYGADGVTYTMEENGSGEDFLYMHRQMVIMVNEMVADTDYEKIVGFKRCPYPGDPKYPVPAAYTTGFSTDFDATIAQVKSDEFFWSEIQPDDEKLWDPEYLRSITLGRLGALVEFTVHNGMHVRFSEKTAIGLRDVYTANPTPNIDVKWDDTTYRWLGDTYSSHVNPIFWKIHGWVDDHIEAWRVANGLDEVPWQFTWEEGPWTTYKDLFAAGDVTDGDGDMASEEDMIAEMQHISRILADAGQFGGSLPINVITSLSKQH